MCFVAEELQGLGPAEADVFHLKFHEALVVCLGRVAILEAGESRRDPVLPIAADTSCMGMAESAALPSGTSMAVTTPLRLRASWGL
ncbi:MAG: hypothetical protein HN904_19740 [Victivallales bacterium]|jgi:hypothetical protein|nr:hypothetical protein [Victivallales bacterium]